MGIEALLKRGRASRRELQTIVGHLTFKSLLRRELLAVGRSVFTLVMRESRIADWSLIMMYGVNYGSGAAYFTWQREI